MVSEPTPSPLPLCPSCHPSNERSENRRQLASLAPGQQNVKMPRRGGGAGREGGPALSPHVPLPVQQAAAGSSIREGAAWLRRASEPALLAMRSPPPRMCNRWANTPTREPFLPHTKHTTSWTGARPSSPSLTPLPALSSSPPLPHPEQLLLPCPLRHRPFWPVWSLGEADARARAAFTPSCSQSPGFSPTTLKPGKRPPHPTHPPTELVQERDWSRLLTSHPRSRGKASAGGRCQPGARPGRESS